MILALIICIQKQACQLIRQWRPVRDSSAMTSRGNTPMTSTLTAGVGHYSCTSPVAVHQHRRGAAGAAVTTAGHHLLHSLPDSLLNFRDCCLAAAEPCWRGSGGGTRSFLPLPFSHLLLSLSSPFCSRISAPQLPSYPQNSRDNTWVLKAGQK